MPEPTSLGQLATDTMAFLRGCKSPHCVIVQVSDLPGGASMPGGYPAAGYSMLEYLEEKGLIEWFSLGPCKLKHCVAIRVKDAKPEEKQDA